MYYFILQATNWPWRRPVILLAHMTAEHYYIIKGLSFCCEVKGWTEVPPKVQVESA